MWTVSGQLRARSTALGLVGWLALVAVPALGPGVASASSGSVCHGHRATIVGTEGDDTVTGTSGDDVIVALGGQDTVHGRGGDDLICGGRGLDSLYGDGGNDGLFGGTRRDRLEGGEGNDALSGGSGQSTAYVPGAGDDRVDSRFSIPKLDYSSAPAGLVVDLPAGTISGWGDDHVRLPANGTAEVLGSAYDDTMIGTDGGNTLLSGAGFDHIDGRGGYDIIGAREGVIVAGEGDDRINLGPLDVQQAQASSIDTGPGNDTVHAPLAIGHLDAGPGDDWLLLDPALSASTVSLDVDAGDGYDQFWLSEDLGTGPFSLDMHTGAATMVGETGTVAGTEDVFIGGSPSNVTIWGTDGPDRINVSAGFGSPSPTRVYGRGGDDWIQTDQADDTIDGGTGTDTARAGAGTNTCISIEIDDLDTCTITGP